METALSSHSLDNLSPAEQALRDAACDYHRNPVRGKIAVTPTKTLSNQRDLSLAYSPGVAVPVLAIAEDPARGFGHDQLAGGEALLLAHRLVSEAAQALPGGDDGADEPVGAVGDGEQDRPAAGLLAGCEPPGAVSPYCWAWRSPACSSPPPARPAVSACDHL